MNVRAQRANQPRSRDRAEPISGPVVSRAPVSTRSRADTRSYGDAGADPFADTVANFGTGSAQRRPEWCVDFGMTLGTMTTFELWAAVEEGHVPPAIRVWREGLECWTPVAQLAEFSWALPSARSPAPARAASATELTALEPGAADATTGPAVRVQRALLANDDEPATGRKAARRGWRRIPGAAWIGLGAAIALGAIGWAIVTERAPAAPELAAAEVGAGLARALVTAAPTPTPAPEARPARAEVLKTVHDERGQRRRRR